MHDIRPDAGRGELIEPAAQLRARDDRDADRIAFAFGRRELQILDRREQLILDRERHGLHQLRAALRGDACFGREHVLGRHQHDDFGRVRHRRRRRQTGRRGDRRASVGAEAEPGRVAGRRKAQQQTIGHGGDRGKTRRL